MIKVMLISKIDAVLSNIRKLITDEDLSVIAQAAGGESALDKIENTSPDILIINSGINDTDAINLAERITQYKPKIFVILIVEDMTVDVLNAANSAGVHNIITLPDTAKELCDYIHTIYNKEKSRLNALNENQRVRWSSKVITIFGAKGGLGKTTISTNLAIKLAEQNKKVALIDLDLQFGDVHIFMDIDPKETLADLMQDVYEPNIDSVRTYMTVHPSGVNVLCAPKSPEYAEIVSAERMQSLLSLIRSYYDYVIIDTASDFGDVTLSAIEASTMILFVTGLDISILKNSKLSMSLLESLKQKNKVRVIVNRAVEINTISVADVQKIIDAPIIARIPSDYPVAVAALNRGQPFVQSAPKSKLSLAIGDIADILIKGTDNFDIQQLTPKERRALIRRYKTKDKTLKSSFFAKK